MLPHPAAFPFFGAFRNLLNSAMVICPVWMPRSDPSERTGECSGAGLFKTSWKFTFVFYPGQDHPVCILNQCDLGSSSPTKQSCDVIDLLHIPLPAISASCPSS